MDNNLYIVAVILLITWLVGFLEYAAGGLVHVLLLLAVIAVLLNITGGNRRRV
jgi:predicted ferric reductase